VHSKEVFRRRGLRYKLVGGFSFYNRAEVKDALAYVPPGNASGRRYLAPPRVEYSPRGIVRRRWITLRESARVDGTPLWAAIEKFVSGASAGRAR